MTQKNGDPARRGRGEATRDNNDCCPECGSWRHASCGGQNGGPDYKATVIGVELGGGRRGFGTAILGLGVLVLGAIMLLDNFGMVDGEQLYDYWPLLLILVGISHFVRPKGSRRLLTGWVWIGIGMVVLLSNLGAITFEIWDLWPVILLIIGGNLVLKPFRRMAGSYDDNASVFEATAILGGANRRLSASNFQGGDATAIMGGCEIDLRDCGTEGGPARIDTFAFWGGIEIQVPEDWEVQVSGLAILGAYSDETRSLEGEARKVLVIGGTAIMGGVEIKN